MTKIDRMLENEGLRHNANMSDSICNACFQLSEHCECDVVAHDTGPDTKPAPVPFRNPGFCCAMCGAGFDFGCRCDDR